MTKSKRIIFILTSLLITLAIATTTTFAWFAVNSQAYLDGIRLELEVGEGLYISSTGVGDFTDHNLDLDYTEGNPLALTAVTPRMTAVTYWKGGVDVTDTVEDMIDICDNAKSNYANAYDVYDANTGRYWLGGVGTGTDVTALCIGYIVQIENNTPTRGRDFDTIEYTDKNWDLTDYGFVDMNGLAMGNAFENGKGWLAQEIFFRSEAPVVVLLENIIVNGVSLGTPIKTPVLIDADTVADVDSDIPADSSIDGDIEAAIRLAFFNSDNQLINAYRVNDGQWEEQEGLINMAGFLYNSYGSSSNNTIGADNIAEINEVRDGNFTSTYITLLKDDVNDDYRGNLTMVIWLEGKDGDCLNSILDDYAKVYVQFAGIEIEINP